MTERAPVLVLGGSGRIGTMLQHSPNGAPGGWVFQSRKPGFGVAWSGRKDDPSLGAFLKTNRVRTLVNLIGVTHASGLDRVAMEEINVHLAMHVLDLAEMHEVDHVVLVSTAAVYGVQADPTNIVEDAKLAPIGDYGITKAQMEDCAIDRASRLSSTMVSILRIGNVAGADTILALAEAGSLSLDQFDDGTTPIRSYIAPADLCTAFAALVDRPFEKGATVFNVTHPQPVSLGSMLEGYKHWMAPDLAWSMRPAGEGALKDVVLNSDRLQALCRFPQYDTPALAFARQVAEYRDRLPPSQKLP